MNRELLIDKTFWPDSFDKVGDTSQQIAIGRNERGIYARAVSMPENPLFSTVLFRAVGVDDESEELLGHEMAYLRPRDLLQLHGMVSTEALLPERPYLPYYESTTAQDNILRALTYKIDPEASVLGNELTRARFKRAILSELRGFKDAAVPAVIDEPEQLGRNGFAATPEDSSPVLHRQRPVVSSPVWHLDEPEPQRERHYETAISDGHLGPGNYLRVSDSVLSERARRIEARVNSEKPEDAPFFKLEIVDELDENLGAQYEGLSGRTQMRKQRLAPSEELPPDGNLKDLHDEFVRDAAHEYAHQDQAVLGLRVLADENGIKQGAGPEEIGRLKRLYLDTMAPRQIHSPLNVLDPNKVSDELVNEGLRINTIKELTAPERARAAHLFKSASRGDEDRHAADYVEYEWLAEGAANLDNLNHREFGELTLAAGNRVVDFGLHTEPSPLDKIWFEFGKHLDEPERAVQATAHLFTPEQWPQLRSELGQLIDQLLPVVRARSEISAQRYMQYHEHEARYYEHLIANTPIK
jgi:hypothetical protein